MEHKYKVGDEVEVIEYGCGCPRKDIGKKVKITKLGEYGGRGRGYIVHPAIGNTKSGFYNGFIGEETFKLVNSWLKNGKPNWKKRYQK